MICLLVLALAAVLRYTQLGLVTRAVIEDPELAASRGVNVRRTYQATFAFGRRSRWTRGGDRRASCFDLSGDGILVHYQPIHGRHRGGCRLVWGVAAAAGIFGVSQSLAVRFISPVTGSVVILLVAVTLLRLRPAGLLRR